MLLWKDRLLEDKLTIILEYTMLINKKVNTIMTQLDDLKTVVAEIVSDDQALLTRLAASTTVQSDPVVAQAITDLQNSHAAVQAVLNPPVSTTPVATPTTTTTAAPVA